MENLKSNEKLTADVYGIAFISYDMIFLTKSLDSAMTYTELIKIFNRANNLMEKTKTNLNNEEFLNKAPVEIVQKEYEKMENAEMNLETIKKAINMAETGVVQLKDCI